MSVGRMYPLYLTLPEALASLTVLSMFATSATLSIHEWAERLRLTELMRSAGVAGALFVVVSLFVLLLEMRGGGNLARFKSKAFVNDVLYCAFYRGGFYAVFVWAAVANLLGDHLGFLRTNLLTHLPLYAAVLVYWIVGDCCAYWAHRALHRFPFLWAFHSVHHAEQQLTTLSQGRRHPVDEVVLQLSIHFPLFLVLGLPTAGWLPWFVTAQMLQALQHAELEWRFGPLYRWVVSPTFHSIHHSVEPEHFNTNFGAMFSIWDYLFGTAAAATQRPRAYGLAGPPLPESIIVQLLTPFRALVRRPQSLTAPRETRVHENA